MRVTEVSCLCFLVKLALNLVSINARMTIYIRVSSYCNNESAHLFKYC